MEENLDFILVREFLAGDETAFNKIVRKYQKQIYWHARHMLGNHLDADEVTQQVLIVIYEKLKNFKFNSSLYTWIFKITSTRSINLIKRNGIKKFFSFDSENLNLKTNEDIVKNIESKEKLRKLDSVLLKIPIKQREVFILRHFEELSYSEIAEIKNRSIGSVKANYFHAIKKVMALMGENDE